MSEFGGLRSIRMDESVTDSQQPKSAPLAQQQLQLVSPLSSRGMESEATGNLKDHQEGNDKSGASNRKTTRATSSSPFLFWACASQSSRRAASLYYQQRDQRLQQPTRDTTSLDHEDPSSVTPTLEKSPSLIAAREPAVADQPSEHTLPRPFSFEEEDSGDDGNSSLIETGSLEKKDDLSSPLHGRAISKPKVVSGLEVARPTPSPRGDCPSERTIAPLSVAQRGRPDIGAAMAFLRSTRVKEPTKEEVSKDQSEFVVARPTPSLKRVCPVPRPIAPLSKVRKMDPPITFHLAKCPPPRDEAPSPVSTTVNRPQRDSTRIPQRDEAPSPVSATVNRPPRDSTRIPQRDEAPTPVSATVNRPPRDSTRIPQRDEAPSPVSATVNRPQRDSTRMTTNSSAPPPATITPRATTTTTRNVGIDPPSGAVSPIVEKDDWRNEDWLVTSIRARAPIDKRQRQKDPPAATSQHLSWRNTLVTQQALNHKSCSNILSRQAVAVTPSSSIREKRTGQASRKDTSPPVESSLPAPSNKDNARQMHDTTSSDHGCGMETTTVVVMESVEDSPSSDLSAEESRASKSIQQNGTCMPASLSGNPVRNNDRNCRASVKEPTSTSGEEPSYPEPHHFDSVSEAEDAQSVPVNDPSNEMFLEANHQRGHNGATAQVHNLSRVRDESESDGDMSVARQPTLTTHSEHSLPSAEVSAFCTNDFLSCIDSKDLNSIRASLQLLYERLDTMGVSGGKAKHVVTALFQAPFEIQHGWHGSLVHRWAGVRYRQSGIGSSRNDSQQAQCPQLRQIDVNLDAISSLKILLDNGADVLAKDGNGQTPLHLAMEFGIECVVDALLSIPSVGADMLNTYDGNGRTPVELAISNGHFSCIRMLMKKFGTKTLFELKDSEENNILAQLARYTDIRYNEGTYSSSGSESLNLLQDLLDEIGTNRLTDDLINENIHGENALHIAAKSGCFCEVEAILKLELGAGRSVANRCVGSCTMMEQSRELVSSLDMAVETKGLVENAGFLELEKRAPFRLERNNSSVLQNWKRNGIIPTIELLEQVQKFVPIELDAVLPSRPPGSEISNGQVLSEEAKEFHKEHTEVGRRSESTTVYLYDMKNIKRTNGDRFRSQIIRCISQGTSEQVSGALVRNPKHSCVRNCPDPTAPQYCLLAVKDIAAGTVISEYAGLVRQESPEDCSAESSYCFTLQRLDEWVMKGSDTCYVKSFILDARTVFNESSLINDVRTDVLERGRPLREENVGCAEVLVDKWPHIFLVSKKEIKSGEELLTDYGPQYWEKHAVSVLQEHVNRSSASIKQLREKLKATRT